MILHILEAIRYAADRPCEARNCGTVCLCGPCHARRALAVLDPSHQPKYKKNHYFPIRLEGGLEAVRDLSPEQQRALVRSLGLTLDEPERRGNNRRTPPPKEKQK